MISLTEEQQSAVEVEKHLLLAACPGSGKTRVILAKLLGLADTVEKSPRRAQCSTLGLRQSGRRQLSGRVQVETMFDPGRRVLRMDRE